MWVYLDHVSYMGSVQATKLSILDIKTNIERLFFFAKL